MSAILAMSTLMSALTLFSKDTKLQNICRVFGEFLAAHVPLVKGGAYTATEHMRGVKYECDLFIKNTYLVKNSVYNIELCLMALIPLFL